MEAKHTPGPWRYVSRNIDEKVNWASRIPFAIEAERNFAVAPIADVFADPLVQVCAQPQAEANARLIAAAPDFISAFDAVDNGDWRALDLLLGHSGHGQFWRGVFNDLRGAIAKATGEQP